MFSRTVRSRRDPYFAVARRKSCSKNLHLLTSWVTHRGTSSARRDRTGHVHRSTLIYKPKDLPILFIIVPSYTGYDKKEPQKPYFLPSVKTVPELREAKLGAGVRAFLLYCFVIVTIIITIIAAATVILRKAISRISITTGSLASVVLLRKQQQQ